MPKALYPFNSINFRNLALACHDCNSSYKLRKDPGHNVDGRRKAFNPYATASYSVEINVAFSHSDVENLVPADIAIEFGPPQLVEQLETWRDVYSVDERYKAKLCANNGGKYWLTQVFDECQSYGIQPSDILASRIQQAQKSPYADCNFLNVAFLEACNDKGIFDNQVVCRAATA